MKSLAFRQAEGVVQKPLVDFAQISEDELPTMISGNVSVIQCPFSSVCATTQHQILRSTQPEDEPLKLSTRHKWFEVTHG